MYRLLKIEGIAPTVATEIGRSQDWRSLEAERDRLIAACFAEGPGSLEKLRYGVSPLSS